VDKEKMSLGRPSKLGPSVSPEEFINSAGKDRPEVEADRRINEPLPWKKPGVRQDVIRGFNLRLREEYMIKLDWIHEQSKLDVNGNLISRNGKSKSKFLIEAACAGIDKNVRARLKELGREHEF